jgi:nucleoside-diphosphate-sugar epimerase
MTRAVIGHTGFVGGTLCRQSAFDEFYNSSNIESIRGRTFDLVVCAGAPAAKWKANLDPERDLENLERLMGCLDHVSARHMILVSTVDVYPSPFGVDEDSPIAENAGAPYSRHRRTLERFVERRFATTIVRLPGLFGLGLRKNAIFDLLHDNQVDKICPDSQYQFYDLQNLWADIETSRRSDIQLVNFATEPTSMREIARSAFGVELENSSTLAAVRYDFRTKHASIFGGRNGYLYDKETVLAAIRRYVEAEGWVRP